MPDDTLGGSVRQLLVVGGYGVAGSAIVEAAGSEADWNIVTAGRRPVPSQGLAGSPFPCHVSVDLLSTKSTNAAFSSLSGITDLAFAAYVEHPTMAQTTAPNVAMLENILAALSKAGSSLQRVMLIGGGKSCGPHLGPYKTPAKESDPSILGPIFYDDQEDVLRDWA